MNKLSRTISRFSAVTELSKCKSMSPMMLLLILLCHRLQKFEIPKAVHLVSEPWTPESGLITAAMKLKRKQIENVFGAEIAQMYLPVDKKAKLLNNNSAQAPRGG